MQRLVFFIISLIVFSACLPGGQKDDFSVDKGVKILRYDRLQYEATALNSVLALQQMGVEFPRATRLLIEDVLAIGSVSEPNIYEHLCAYYTDSVLMQIMADGEKRFKDLSAIEKQFTEAFGKLKEEIPSLVIPQIYAQYSALNQSVVVGDSLLGISLDKYMGADYPLYKRYYYDYQCKLMAPEYIVPDCIMFYLLAQYPFPWAEGHRTLLDFLLYRGKIAWVVEQILDGDVSGELSLGYTKQEVRWCKKHRESLWKWMSDNRHLNSTDPMLIRAYTYPAPTLRLKGESVPLLVGVWIGMQLADEYMKEHKEVTLEQLLRQTDFSKWIKEKNS